MLTSIPFIFGGGQKSPFPQPPAFLAPGTATIPGQHLMVFPAADLTDHLKPRGHSKLHFQVKSKVVVSGWVLKNPKQNSTTHTHTALNCVKPELDLYRKIQGKEEKEVLASYTQKKAAACVSVFFFYLIKKKIYI